MCGRVFDISKLEIFEIFVLEKDIRLFRIFKSFSFSSDSHDIVATIFVVLLIVVVVNRDDTCSSSGGEPQPIRKARLWQVGVRAGRENVVSCSIHGYAMWKPRDTETERRTDRHRPGESPLCGRWRRRFLVSRSDCQACF